MNIKKDHIMTGQRATHFLRVVVDAMVSQDHESVEHLRRILGIEEYRRAYTLGENPSETDAVPDSHVVKRWLAQLDPGVVEAALRYIEPSNRSER